jgi:hypothetical protein
MSGFHDRLRSKVQKFWLFNINSRDIYVCFGIRTPSACTVSGHSPKETAYCCLLGTITWLPHPSACIHLYINSDLAWLIAYALVAYCMTHGLHYSLNSTMRFSKVYRPAVSRQGLQTDISRPGFEPRPAGGHSTKELPR